MGQISFIKGCSEFIQDLRKSNREQYSNYLADVGATMLQAAYYDRTFVNQTFNLADSYAWALYYDCSLYSFGFLTSNASATDDKDGKYGRDVVKDFIHSYNALTRGGYELIFVAAMFYGKYLERPDLDEKAKAEGYTYQARKVISYIWDDLAVIFKPKQVTQL